MCPKVLVISGDFNLHLDDLRDNDTKKFMDLLETFSLSQHVSARPFYRVIPYYRKLTLHEIKVLEINANLMENDFRIKKINAKKEVEFHNKGN